MATGGETQEPVALKVEPTTSRMVAEEPNLQGLSFNATTPTSQIANLGNTPSDIKRWRARDGRCYAHQQWEWWLRRQCIMLGIDYEQLHEPMPDYKTLLTAQYVKHQHGTRLNAEQQAQVDQHATALTQAWQKANTSLFWTVQPSIIVGGVWAQSDEAEIQAFVSGTLADGSGFVRWARKFCDVTNLEMQQKLYKKVISAKIGAGSTQQQLAGHLLTLLDRWGLVAGNDVTKPMPYYKQVLMSLSRPRVG